MKRENAIRPTHPSPQATWTRRGFLQTTLGSVLALSAAACDDLGLEEDEPLFDGPQINEDDFIAFNAAYYDIGIDAKTQFPYTAFINGEPHSETDPIAIAYRIQYLIDQGGFAATTIETILDHLLAAQVSGRPPKNYRNMIPRLTLKDDEVGFEAATFEYSFVRNALLSSRVAMAAQAFAGTAVEDKALTFLDKQKAGYNEALSRTPSGFLPTFAHAGLFAVDPDGLNLLFGGFYEAVAFVLSYFIGDTEFIADPQTGLDSWQAMIAAQNTFVDEHFASTTGPLSIPSPLARNGSAFQYFYPLLSLQPDALTPSLAGALYNVLYSYLDAATFDRLPGIYSAGPADNGGFLFDNGLNRLAARQRFQGSQETVVTIDALAAAMRLFPVGSDERLTLGGWIGLYASLSGALSPHGYFGGIDKEGRIVQSMYARQNGAMILFNSNAADHLEAFLTSRGRPGMRELFSQIVLTHQGTPIARIDAPLPLPPNADRLFTRVG